MKHTILFSTAKNLQKRHSLSVNNIRFIGTCESLKDFKGKHVCDVDTLGNSRLDANMRRIYVPDCDKAPVCNLLTLPAAVAAALRVYRDNKVYSTVLKYKLYNMCELITDDDISVEYFESVKAYILSLGTSSLFMEQLKQWISSAATLWSDIHFAYFAVKMWEESKAEKESAKYSVGQSLEISGTIQSITKDESSAYNAYIFEIKSGDETFFKRGSRSLFGQETCYSSVGDEVHFYTRVRFISKKGQVWIDRIAKNPYKD